MSIVRHNPFATRYTRPGAIAYVCPDEWTLESLVDRLKRQGWRGEILGAHGTGKSTLLASLIPLLRQADRDVVTIHVPPHPRSPIRWNARSWNARTLVVVDGYEELGSWARWRLRFVCRRRGAGLLITAHRAMGLPPLVTTSVSHRQLHLIVRQLLIGAGAQNEPKKATAEAEQLAARWLDQYHGNMRETLFALFDWHQAHTSAPHGGTHSATHDSPDRPIGQ